MFEPIFKTKSRIHLIDISLIIAFLTFLSISVYFFIDQQNSLIVTSGNVTDVMTDENNNFYIIYSFHVKNKEYDGIFKDNKGNVRTSTVTVYYDGVNPSRNSLVQFASYSIELSVISFSIFSILIILNYIVTLIMFPYSQDNAND